MNEPELLIQKQITGDFITKSKLTYLILRE